MLKRIVLPLAVASVTALWACQSESVVEPAGPAPGRSADTTAETVDATAPPVVEARDAASTELVSTVEVAAATPVEFDDNAFPPTLPGDDDHSGAWLRTDCLLCHESGIQDAPIVNHSGMSRLLLSSRCRSCHVVVSPEAEADDAFPFARNAFPPTLPTDADHSGAWLRNDCILCHEDGTQGAPRVVHRDMAPLLLKGRCRSCHLPRVSSQELASEAQ